MTKNHYNNVIAWTLKNDPAAKTGDTLAGARAIFKNMGVALPNGNMETVASILATNDYMGWRACSAEEAQAAADHGTAAIAVTEDAIHILPAADDTLNSDAAVVRSVDEAVAYYTYSCGTTTVIPPEPNTPDDYALSSEEMRFISTVAGEAIGEGATAQKAVAHVIMNRYYEPRDSWSNSSSVTDVLTVSAFSSIGGNQYSLCHGYLANRDGTNSLYENLISTVLPVYYGQEQDITHGAHFIFNITTSSGAQLKASLDAQPNRYSRCPSVAGVDNSKFCMYRCEW